MSRITIGLLGILVGIVSTLAVQGTLARVSSPAAVTPAAVPSTAVPVRGMTPSDAERTASLFEAGPIVLEKALPGSKCLDVWVGHSSKRAVSYVHDALYDLQLTYRYRGAIKRVVLPFGFTGGVTVVPTTSEFVIADDTAEVVHTLQLKPSGRAR